jgi:hypothetical protein
MKALILLILPAVLLAQLPKPGNGGGGGGGSTGSSNPSCTFASSATTCSIDVSSLNVTSANYKTILAECFTGASTTQTPVTITNYAYTTGSGIVQTVAPTFGAAAAAGYCAANGNGGAGPTGPAGVAGPTGSTGAAGPGYGGTSTTSVSVGSGLKTFTTQAGLAYLVGVPIRATSSGAPTTFMQGTVNSYSGTTLVIDVNETGGVGTRTDWNLSLIGIDGTAGANGTNGAGYTATTTTSVTVSTGSKTVTTQAGLAYVVGSLVKIVSAATPANYVQGLATAYSGTSLTVNATETGGSGSFTDGNITIAGSTGAQGPAGTGGGAVYASDTSVTPNLITITPSPAITYTDGTQVLVRVNNDSTGPVNINANGLGNIPVTTTTGLAMYYDAFKHDGVYLFAYRGGAFQLMGSAACIQVTTGLSCGPGWITMRGNTGYRVYATETTGASDAVYIVGYLQGYTPTTGNCAQWAVDGGAPVMNEARSGCVQKFLGTAAPGSVTGNLPGDLFTDTTNHQQYVCNAPSGTAAPACTSVTAAGWLLVNGGGAGTVTLQVNGSSAVSGSGSTLNFATSTGLTSTASNAGGVPTDTIAPDTTVLATRPTVQGGTDSTCAPVSASPTAYTCVLPTPLTAYTSGMRMVLKPDVNCTAGTITLAIDGLSPARKLFAQDGSTNLTAAQCATTTQPLMIYDGTLDSGTGAWRVMTGGSSTTDTPIDNGSWFPYGGLDAAISVFTTPPAANKVWYYQIEVPRPGRVVRNIKSFSAVGSTNVAWGIYDSSCNIVVQGHGTGPGQNFLNIAVTPTTLTPAIYYIALSADGSQNYFMSGFDGSGYGAGLTNLGLSSSTYRIFEGQNVSTTSAGVTTLPSSCGATRTVLGDTTSITAVRVIPLVELQ